MGNEVSLFGLTEAGFTVLAYGGYLISFLLYSAFLMSRSGRALRVPRQQLALAGAMGGGTVDITETQGNSGNRPPVGYSPLLGRAATAFVLLSWLALICAIGLRWIAAGHYPVVTLYEVTTMLVWGTTTIYLVLFEGVLKTRIAGAFVVLLIFCLHSYAVWFIPVELKRIIQLVPALRSNWLLIHVSFAIFSYSAFAVAAGVGLTFLAKHYLKVKPFSSLPSEAAIEEFMFRAVAIGFPLQTLLLITGAIWAKEAWTKAWSWDPKETWALITWLTYAAYLHVRVQRGVRGVTMAWLSLIGFVVVMFTFVGVNYLVQWFGMESMHTYNIDSGAPPGLNIMGVGMVILFVGLLGIALFSWLRLKFPKLRGRTE